MPTKIARMNNKDLSDAGAVVAAIATAIFEVTEDVHDSESTTLHIRKVERRHSQWSAKIYGLRTFLRK